MLANLIICLSHIVMGLYVANIGRTQKNKILLISGLVLSLFHLVMIVNRMMMKEEFTLDCHSDITHLKRCKKIQDDTPKERTEEEQKEMLKKLVSE